jgi:ribA/ribD-fused uncharacterized protein
MAEPITSFRGKYRFLSNFYPSPIAVSHGTYFTVEHAYQASKCYHEADRQAIRGAATPAEAKRLGQKVRMRDGWEREKLMLMYNYVKAKFETHDFLRYKLLATDDAHLEEGSIWGDTFWGTVNGLGQNRLGKILMRIREECRALQ